MGVAGALPARAQESICVALVVDFGALGGGVQSTCAQVPAGSTGVDVLRAGRHQLTFCSDGIIGEIDGVPANGCRTKDSTHYWSYWHRPARASRWVYSTEGPGTYRPGNASTEGWAWQDGGSHNRQPADVPYGDICRPSPSPSPRATAATAPTSAPPATAAHRAASKSGQVTASPATAATPTPRHHSGGPHRHHHRQRAPAATAAAPTSAPATRAPAGSLAGDVHGVADGPSGGQVAVVVLVAAGIAALGGAAVWRARRSRGSP